jgi:hypothetical protein
MAESEGFEPPIDLRLCLISSQVHSTGLCQLSALHLLLVNYLRIALCLIAFAAERLVSVLVSLRFPAFTSRRQPTPGARERDGSTA